MLRVFCCMSLSILLSACGKAESKLPQVCFDFFESVEVLNVKAETNPYVSAALAEDVKRGSTRSLRNTKISLSKTSDVNIHTRNCKILLMGYQSVIEKLDKAKTTAEAEEALFYFKNSKY